jgi:hypothetical protein
VLAHAIKAACTQRASGDNDAKPVLGRIISARRLGNGSWGYGAAERQCLVGSSWEVKLRDLFEQTLMARPRTKEILLGYPALWLWYIWRGYFQAR